jgi:hypothetical protein
LRKSAKVVFDYAPEPHTIPLSAAVLSGYAFAPVAGPVSGED